MATAFNIRAENYSAKPTIELWDKVACFEHKPSMKNLNYAPHFTFAIYEDLPEELAEETFQIVSENSCKVRVTFSKICYFDAEKLVLWLRAKDEIELHAIHAEIHEHLPVEKCHEYYRPDVWQPHCTLGMDIALESRDAAIKFANTSFEPFEVKFNIFDWLTFLPVQIKDETILP